MATLRTNNIVSSGVTIAGITVLSGNSNNNILTISGGTNQILAVSDTFSDTMFSVGTTGGTNVFSVTTGGTKIHTYLVDASSSTGTSTSYLGTGNSGTIWKNLTGNTGSFRLTSNFTTSSTAATSTPLAFVIGANESYTVQIAGTCSKATSATGLKFGIAAPSGCLINGVQYGGGATLAASLVPSLITSINTLGTTLSTGTGIQVGFNLNFTVINSSTVGNITLQMATVTSNTATLYSGTTMTWVKNSAV